MSNHEEGISRGDYLRLCDLIYAEAGIHLGTEKKSMLEIRVKRRLKALNLTSYSGYCDYVFGAHREQEIVQLIDVVTTNKTDFFRESRHFDFLTAKALPELCARRGAGGRSMLVWSAGCSTGEEPYTLGIVLSEYARAHVGFRFRILATDISTDVLTKASRGVFSEEAVKPVPPLLRSRYFLRSKDRASQQMRVTDELRRLVEFRRVNFMDSDYGLGEKADAIFCRNVIIYFDRQTQERILQRLSDCLVPGGYLFVGHAETLHSMHLPVTPVAPSLYRKTDEAA